MIWLLLHWKFVLAAGAAAMIAIPFFVPAIGRVLWARRVPLLVAAALFASHGLVAVGTQQFFDQAERIARAERARDEALLRVIVLEADAASAEQLRANADAWRRRYEKARDELEDASRICFDQPDADRLRDQF